MADQTLAGLLAWFELVGISVNAQLIRLQPMPGSRQACEVVAVRDIAAGAVLGEVPAAACLSPKTCSIASLLEEEKLGGGLALTVAVMHEVALGPRSKWCVSHSCVLQRPADRAVEVCCCRHGYFQSLPAREYVPMFWSAEELSWLAGTEAEALPSADRCSCHSAVRQSIG